MLVKKSLPFSNSSVRYLGITFRVLSKREREKSALLLLSPPISSRLFSSRKLFQVSLPHAPALLSLVSSFPPLLPHSKSLAGAIWSSRVGWGELAAREFAAPSHGQEDSLLRSSIGPFVPSSLAHLIAVVEVVQLLEDRGELLRRRHGWRRFERVESTTRRVGIPQRRPSAKEREREESITWRKEYELGLSSPPHLVVKRRNRFSLEPKEAEAAAEGLAMARVFPKVEPFSFVLFSRRSISRFCWPRRRRRPTPLNPAAAAVAALFSSLTYRFRRRKQGICNVRSPPPPCYALSREVLLALLRSFCLRFVGLIKRSRAL